MPAPADSSIASPISQECMPICSMRETLTGTRHRFRFDVLVEVCGAEKTEFDSGFAKGRVVYMRGMGNFGGLIVTDDGTQCRHQHQRIAYIAVETRTIDFDADGAVLGEAV